MKSALSLTMCISLLLASACPVILTQSGRQPDSGARVVTLWNEVAEAGIRRSGLGAPIAARALAILNTCMYNSWAAYDDVAVSTELADVLRRPVAERTDDNRRAAVSYAAFLALQDLMPEDVDALFRPLLERLGYKIHQEGWNNESPAGVATIDCTAVLQDRHHDGANQLGDYAYGPYSDWTKYASKNRPTRLPATGIAVNEYRWQPVVYVNSSGEIESQQFLAPHWYKVRPFALEQGDELRSQLVPLPPEAHTNEMKTQVDELVKMSGNLSDSDKMMIEFWSDGFGTDQPAGHWMRLASELTYSQHSTMSQVIKLNFALSNSLMDAGIVAWDAKRTFDNARPITLIPKLLKGKQIASWKGPGKGVGMMDGSEWQPYQSLSSPSPAFPDFVSGHSTFSAAACEILRLWKGDDQFHYRWTSKTGSSGIEPGLVPDHPIELGWNTFTQAADQAGLSRRLGGLHFASADLAGRRVGRLVADRAWSKSQELFSGKSLKVNDLSSIQASSSETDLTH